MRPVRVLSVVSEIYPIIKTGGLADVAGALPNALKENDVETRTLIPGYPVVVDALEDVTQVFTTPLLGGMARLLMGRAAGLDLFVLDAPHLFGRPGNPYLSPEGSDWSIHNLAFQGLFAREILEVLGLPPEAFAVDGVEYYGRVGFLKAGIQFADRITTVSPTYAREIQTDDEGMGLGGLLRARSGQFSGITNGIDMTVWNPETDPSIPYPFSSDRLNHRQGNKVALQHRFGLAPDENAFLLGVISRLSWQKGLDVLAACIPALLNEGMQLALLGTGDAEIENRFRAAAQSHPDRVSALIGYDEEIAHQIQAGADAIVVPSRFEPCGLTQLCALRYGAVPIVSRVGGLNDTVADLGESTPAMPATGFKFAAVAQEPLTRALVDASRLFKQRASWRKMQLNGLTADVSWQRSAARYAELYRELCYATG
jgi:starch synthase